MTGPTRKCFYCPKTNDLRPYGPNGADVCFKCAMKTPERTKNTEARFSFQLGMAGNIAVIDTKEEVGPRSFEQKENN